MSSRFTILGAISALDTSRPSGRNFWSDMAEALGIAGSIIALLQATQTVITYVREVEGANEERSNILSEANNLYHFLLVLKDKVPNRAQPGDTWFTMFRSFEAPGGPLEQFKLLLERLASKLKCAKVVQEIWTHIFLAFSKARA